VDVDAMDMSDDDVAAGPSGAASSDFNLPSDDEETRGRQKKREGKGDEGDVKSKKKGRKPRKESLDLALSSGDEGDDPDFKLPETKKTTRKSSRKPKSN
jgi:hypothetical protein